MDRKKQVAIIGAGPAGIAAAIYLKRAGMDLILFERQQPGGLLRQASLVENYPGFPNGIPGIKLVESIAEQLYNLEVSITQSEVRHVDIKDDAFLIQTEKESVVSSIIIIASGTIPKKLELKIPRSIEGKLLFYDPFSLPRQNNKMKKRILVIGAGDIAFDYSSTLLDQGHEVTIISRSEPICLPLLRDRVSQKGATVHTQCIPQEIKTNPEGILLLCEKNGTSKDIPADFILIATGREPNISFLSPTLKKCYETITDIPQTSSPGLFFAGDVVRGTYRQVGIAVGDGIHAAMIAEHHLKDHPVES
jgi:thioredoxin reductase (NADPH)